MSARDEILPLQYRGKIVVYIALVVVLRAECERSDGSGPESAQGVADDRERIILAVIVADEVAGLGVPQLPVHAEV